MAFNVTPTSGVSPYVFNIAFTNKENFGSQYSLEFAQVNNIGACIFDYSLGSNLGNIASILLNFNSYTWPAPSVPVGTCRSVNVRVRRLFDNKIMSGSTVTIDNV